MEFKKLQFVLFIISKNYYEEFEYFNILLYYQNIIYKLLYLYNLNFKIFRIKEENLKKIIKIVERKIIILVFEGRCDLIIIRNYV